MLVISPESGITVSCYKLTNYITYKYSLYCEADFVRGAKNSASAGDDIPGEAQ